MKKSYRSIWCFLTYCRQHVANIFLQNSICTFALRVNFRFSLVFENKSALRSWKNFAEKTGPVFFKRIFEDVVWDHPVVEEQVCYEPEYDPQC